MKRLFSMVVTLVAMAAWWVFAKHSDYSQIVDVLGLLGIGIAVPLGMEQLIPR